MKKRRSS